MRLTPLLLAAALAGCSGDDADKADATDGTDGTDGTTTADGQDGGTGGTGDGADGSDGSDGGGDGADGSGGTEPLQEACDAGEDGTIADVTLREFSSTVTWALDFDTTAEAAGQSDCSYTRDYTALEMQGFEHLCGDCEAIFRGTAVMRAEGEDCYRSLIGADPGDSVALERTEWWGVSADGRLFRTGTDQAPMGELTTFSGGADEAVPVSWDSSGTAPAGGNVTFTASGTMQWQDSTTTEPDFWGPRAAPYACGWECNDPGDLVGDYELNEGDVVPNVRLRDQCGDMVDLHDFYGSYVVLDLSQYDCPPCRDMAEQSEAFIEEMRAAGIPVRVVTLMGDGLSDPFGTPSSSTVDAWVSTYGITDPVLYDRGYGYAVIADFIEEADGGSLGFPAWAVLNPQLEAIGGGIGFSSWDNVGIIIVNDME